MADLDPRVFDQMNRSLDEINDKMSDFARAGVDVSSALGKTKKNLDEVQRSLNDSTRKIIKQEKAYGALVKAEELLKRGPRQRKRELEKLTKTQQRMVAEYMALSKRRLSAEKRDIEGSMRLEKKAVDEKLKQQERYTRSIEKEGKKRSKAESQATEAGPGKLETAKNIQNVLGSIWGRGKRPGSLMTPKGIMGAREDFGESKKQFSKLSGIFGDAAEGMTKKAKDLKGVIGTKKGLGKVGAALNAKKYSAAAGALGGLSKAAGLLAKAGGPIMMVVSVLAMLAKGAFNLQKFITGLNKTFLQLAGPTAAMRDVPGAMKEFNRAIFDVRRNLKLGIKSKDIQEMFGAMAGAGMSLRGAKGNIGAYGEAIYQARQLSLEFGTSMADMGKMVADQMLTLRTSMDDVGESFRAIAYDASKAGINATKFYQSVETSTANLAYFGNYMKNASGTLSSFVSGLELGFKDAQKATSGLYEAFAKFDVIRGMKLLNIMGKDATEMFKDIYANDKDRIASIKQQLADATVEFQTAPAGTRKSEAANKIEKLRKQLEKEEERSRQLGKAISKADRGDSSDLALQIGRMADRQVEVFQKLLDFSGEYTPAQMKVFSQILQVSEEQVYMTKANLQNTKVGFQELVTKNAKALDLFAGNKRATDALKDVLDKGIQGPEMIQIMSEALKDSGLSSEEMHKFIGSLNTNLEANMGGPVKDLLTFLEEGGQLKDFLKGYGLNKEIAKAIQGGTSIADEAMKMSDERLSEVVDKITSAKDYLDITTESAKYFGGDIIASGIFTLTGVARGILDEVKFLAKDARTAAAERNRDIVDTIRDRSSVQAGIQKEANKSLDEFAEGYKKLTGRELKGDEAAQIAAGFKAGGPVGVKELGEFKALSEGMTPTEAKKKYQELRNQLAQSAGEYKKLSKAADKNSMRIKENMKTLAEEGIADVGRQAIAEGRDKAKIMGTLGTSEQTKAADKQAAEEISAAIAGRDAETVGQAAEAAAPMDNTRSMLSTLMETESSKKTVKRAISPTMTKAYAVTKEEKAKRIYSAFSNILKDMGVTEAEVLKNLDLFTGPLRRDFSATRGGIALLDKGDTVFKPPAAGVDGQAGAFVEKVRDQMFPTPMMGKGAPKSVKFEVNVGGLTVQGDVADPAVLRNAAENLGDMINQAISKRQLESMTASG